MGRAEYVEHLNAENSYNDSGMELKIPADITYVNGIAPRMSISFVVPVSDL